jgi:sulfite exporter TauE/SafE
LNELFIISGTAALIGLVHTLIGPDHYLPFIVMSKTWHWSRAKTALITFLCGLGHILSSVVLGLIGIALGIAVFKLEAVESIRGEIAAWILIAFGFTYLVWGIHKALRSKTHEHLHEHENQESHSHTHSHILGHSHVHTTNPGNMTPWILFTIFVFGPCEPLIPLVMYPAAKHNAGGVVLVAAIFGIVTIATMMTVVMLSHMSLSKLSTEKLGRYSHASAGLAILACGLVIKFLPL